MSECGWIYMFAVFYNIHRDNQTFNLSRVSYNDNNASSNHESSALTNIFII